MKALTICQPYASLICEGRKRIENRSWPTGYRGPLLIHAGKSKNYLQGWNVRRDGFLPQPMPMGAVVGMAELVACYHLPAIREKKIQLPPEHSWIHSHQHTEGPALWVLEDVQRLKEPIPWNGKQGLWDPAELIASVDWMFAELLPVQPVDERDSK